MNYRLYVFAEGKSVECPNRSEQVEQVYASLEERTVQCQGLVFASFATNVGPVERVLHTFSDAFA